MLLPGCCAIEESTIASHRTSVMFCTGSQFPFASSSVYLLVYKLLNGAVPGYLQDYCIETHSSASGLRLQSTDKHDLCARRMKTRFGDHAFSAAGPGYW